MGAPTVSVTCTAADQSGSPVAGGRYTARLDQTEIYGGFVVPEVVEAVADALGVAVLRLWPNALGVAGSTYSVTAINPDTGKKFLDKVVVSVPNSACNLHQILLQEPYPLVSASQQALMDVQAALPGINASRDGAAASAVAANTARLAVDAVQAGHSTQFASMATLLLAIQTTIIQTNPI